MNETDVGLSALPQGWVWTTLKKIIEPSKEKVNPLEIEEVPYISLEHIEKDTGKLLGHGSSIDVKSLKTKFTRGDLLYGKLRPYLNKVYISDFGGVCSTDLLVFPKNELLSNTFFLYRFLCRDFVNYTSHNVSGVNLPRVNFQTLSQYKILLPPLSEQNRIVAKIEELFTKLDAGREELLQAKARLKRYRQSVLKAAMDGNLTEDWRKTHEGEIEPATVLLDRIFKKRRKKWEAEQLEQMKAKGKTPKDDKWKNKYKEPLGIDTSKLPELPEGWVWMTLREVIQIIDYRGRTPPYSSKGIPHLRSANIKNGSIIWDDLKYVTEETYDKFMTRGLPRQGDLLFTTEAPLGEVAFVPNKKFSLAQRIMILRPSEDLIRPGFLLYQIRAGSFQERLRINETGSVVTGISSRNFKPFPLIIPPLSEQQVIVSEVERRLSVADAVEVVVDAELKRSDALRQSILKQAFSGKLVPQNPNDEPAEKLLERIEDKMKRETEQKSKRNPKKTRIREQGLTKINDLLVGKTQYTRIYDTLKSVGQPLSPDELLKLSKLDVDEFYAQLKAEIESGRIAERRSDKTTVFLEGKNEA